MNEKEPRDLFKEFLTNEDDTQSASRDLLTPEGRKPLERIVESPEHLKTEVVPMTCGHFQEGASGRACPSCHAIVCNSQGCDKGACSFCGKPICVFCSRTYQSANMCLWCLTDLTEENELQNLEKTYRAIFPWVTDGETK